MAAIGSAANREMEIVRVTVAAANTWEVFTPPSWVRRVTVANEHASEDLYLADPAQAAGAINTATHHYTAIPARQALPINFEPGRGANADRRQVVLTRAAGAASRDVSLLLEG